MGEQPSKEELLKQAKQHLDEGRYDKAAQSYQQLLAISPHEHRVRLRLAEIHVRLKEVSQAIEAYQFVAQAYAEEEFYLKAVTVYKNMLRLNPSMHEANLALADLYEKMGLPGDAIHQLHILIRYYQQKGEHEQLLALRKRIVALDPEQVTNRIRLAEALQVSGEDDASTQEYEHLAAQLQDSGSEDQLIDLYEKILSRRPSLDLLQRLARIYFARKEVQKLLKWLTGEAELVASDPELLRMHAQILARQNQVESSRSKWRELAQVYLEREEPEAAIQAYEEALVVSADSAEEWEVEIEAVREGAFAEIFESAEIRRMQLAEAESAQEALELAQAAAADSLRSDDAPREQRNLSPEEQEALSRRGESSIQLAEAYEQMGMPAEAGEEYGKALACFQQLLAAGAGDHTVLAEVQRLEAELARLDPDATIGNE